MADPLYWKEGEGYDIHVLRGGPTSKALDGSLNLQSHVNALPPRFIPHFKGAPNGHGVDVIVSTGEVSATAQPRPPDPKFPNFNFLMTVRQSVGGVGTYETKIRIHVHDSIEKIWLTPSTLTVHVDQDPAVPLSECRFTVLALFDDGTVGDITDWPQLTFKSSDVNVVDVLASRVLQAKTPGKSADITVTLNLTSPPTNKNATAKVFAEPSWAEVGQAAKVQFVAGPVPPNENDLDSTKADSVNSVVENTTNILFVSEGFRKGQEQDFTKAVADIVNKLRTETYLEPFMLLKGSINYWSVFIESREEGISVLGDQEIGGHSPMQPAFQVPLPRQPSTARWTVANMIHEGGLPLPLEARVQDPTAWVATRAKIYDIPVHAPDAPEITQGDLDAWNDLRSRSLLNERDSAFGMAHYDRPRASGQDESDADERLLLDRRRTSEASLREFITFLRFGKDPETSSGASIGRTWVEDRSGSAGKDFPLVCFVCQSATRGGAWQPSGRRTMPYFTASTGRGDRALVTTAANGKDINIIPPMSKHFSAPVFASLVARGCGHALSLQDEDGDGEGNVPSLATRLYGPNIQGEDGIVTTTPVRAIDAQKIAWLWPRIIKAAIVRVEFNANDKLLSPEKCDSNGMPTPTGSFVLVQLRKSPLKPFANGDEVRLRVTVSKIGDPTSWASPSSDPFAAIPLLVEKVINDRVVLGYKNPGTLLDLTLFKTGNVCALIGPRIEAGAVSLLVAAPILRHIDTSDSPLNAPLNSQGKACTRAPHARADVPASNLPQGLNLPKELPSKADIVGIYDGGGHFDCGIFRPAGRCRMRRGLDATIPFCQVCCYIIVDIVDPTKHGKLDDFYELQYPT